MCKNSGSFAVVLTVLFFVVAISCIQITDKIQKEKKPSPKISISVCDGYGVSIEARGMDLNSLKKFKMKIDIGNIVV